MQALRFLFPSERRIAPQPFVYGAIAVYLIGIASHLLTTPDVVTRAGLWPFIVAQLVLVWLWFALHAGRLHDAGHSGAAATGVALLYILSVVLLLIVAAGFFNTSAAPLQNVGAGGALELILLLYVIVSLIGSPHYDLAWLMVAALTFLAFVPTVVAVIFSIWAATRPRQGKA